MPERDGQTDGRQTQTNRIPISMSRVSVLTRDDKRRVGNRTQAFEWYHF